MLAGEELVKRVVSRRERQVLKLVALGLGNKEIASRLGIATSTVGQHVRNLLLKMGVSNRTQLAVSALQERYRRTRQGRTTIQ